MPAGTAAGSATLSGLAAGAVTIPATAAGSLSLGGAGGGGIAATGSFSATLSGAAVGLVVNAGSAAATATLGGAAVGTVAISGVIGASAATLGGIAVGQTEIPAAASGATLSGLAVGAVHLVATASSSLSLTSTAHGIAMAQPAFDGLQLFLTPWVRDRAPYLPDSPVREIALWRHFENRLRGVLVWLRNDGTYCVDTICNYEAAMTQPAAFISDDPIGPDLTADFQGLTDSNVNYPWNPFPSSTNSNIPGSFAFNTNWDRTTEDFILNPYMIQWWEGAAENIIRQDQALALTMAGFGDCIGPAPEGAVLGDQPDGQGPYGSWAINA